MRPTRWVNQIGRASSASKIILLGFRELIDDNPVPYPSS